MGLVAVVQGFKLSVAKFDEFLNANGLHEINGYSPSPDEAADIANLFKAKGVDCEVRIFVPYVTGYNRSHQLFVCCDWLYVHASREIEGELQKPIPPTFEAMRTSLKADSGISHYVVYNDEDTMSWTPEEIVKRNTWPVHCGACDEVFSVWQDRMRHRREQHGISEEQNPLPDC